MIKQANQLGASLLGRVEPRMAGTSFSSADRGGYDADFNNRLLQNLANRGIKVLDKVINAELENEMVKGATQAMAGVAEENLETSFLTKNFTVAGHRNMTAKMHHQSWQAQILDEIAKGEHNNLSPTEFGAYLNQSMQEVLNDVSGMSMDAKSSMLETMLTGNQTLLAKQTKQRAESIVNTSMGLYSMQANNLLEQAKLDQGTDLEGATIQQIQAFIRSIDADPNLTPENKSKLMGDYLKGASELGLVEVARAMRGTVLRFNEDGSPATLLDTIGTDDYVKSKLEENKAIKANRWVYNEQGVKAFTQLRTDINNNTFTGTEDDLISALRFARINEIISEGDANTIARKFYDNQYLDRHASQLSTAWKNMNLRKFQDLKSSPAEGRKAFIQEGVDMGLTLTDQVSRINSVFKLSNGDSSAVDWIGSSILQPILNEVINSEGDILTENGQLFNHIITEIDSIDETKQGLYISNLILGLDDLQANFVMNFIGNRGKGASSEGAMSTARENYLHASSAKVTDRSIAVRDSSKNIEEALKDFKDVGAGDNFLWNRTWGSWFGNEGDSTKRILGSKNWWNKGKEVAVDQAYGFLVKAVDGDLKKYIHQAGREVSASELKVQRDKFMLNRVKGDTSGNFVIFSGVEGIAKMFPGKLTTELKEQENELISYVTKTLSEQDEYDDVLRTYTFANGFLTANMVNKEGQPLTREYTPEEYLYMVEDYKAGRFRRIEQEDWGQAVYALSRQATKSATKFTDKQGTHTYNFNLSGYDNSRASYSRKFIDELYQDIIQVEGMTTTRYSDGSNGAYSMGLAVNSANANDPRYKPYFDLEKKQGYLTKEQAEALAEVSVKDHLDRSSKIIENKLGKEYLGVSGDFEKAIFKLTYVGVNNITDELLQAVVSGDVGGIISSLQDTPFFKVSANGRTDNQHYEYVLGKLIGATDDFSTRGVR